MYFLQVFQVHMMINFLGVLLEGNVYFVFSNVCSGIKERLLYSQERTFQDLGNQKRLSPSKTYKGCRVVDRIIEVLCDRNTRVLAGGKQREGAEVQHRRHLTAR